MAACLMMSLRPGVVPAGGGAAVIGGAVGIPLLLKQAKVWDETM